LSANYFQQTLSKPDFLFPGLAPPLSTQHQENVRRQVIAGQRGGQFFFSACVSPH
jgi:hypothetical protein